MDGGPRRGGRRVRLPLTTLEGALVGRVAVQIFGDFSERLCVTVAKALIAEKAIYGPGCR